MQILKTTTARAYFLRTIAANQIEPVIRNRCVCSPSVVDNSDVRHAARRAAHEIFVESGYRDPKKVANMLNQLIRKLSEESSEDADVNAEDGIGDAAPAFNISADDFQWQIWLAALIEDDTWAISAREYNNVVVLAASDLGMSLSEIDTFCKTQTRRQGLTRVSFQDSDDVFELLLQPSNKGYSVSARVNGAQAYQLNARIFGRSTDIGSVLRVAAGEKV